MSLPLVATTTHWACTYCPSEDVTHEARPHSRMHFCPGMRGLWTPMYEAGRKVKVEVVEREDYVGNEIVQVDPERGRPVMAVVTEYEDGRQDAVVYAPTATARASLD